MVSDMNQDGKLDLVDCCVFLGGGDGTFGAPNYPPVIGSYGAASLVGIGDFNGDGKLDAALTSSPAGIMVALGAGDGTYKGGFEFPFPNEGVGAIGDFNNDGKLDVVTANGYLLLQTTLGLTPFNLTFGSQNVGSKSVAQNATLTNVGTAALVINKIFLTGSAPGQFTQTNDCGSSLAAGSSCTVSVVFAPTRSGALAAALTVSYQGTASPQSVALSGTGVASPTVTLTPTSLTFATRFVGTTSASQTANLSNTGSLPVTISSIAVSGAFSQTNNCPATLAASTSCQIQVVFKPKKAGTSKGSLSVVDNAKGGTQWAALSGTGTVITVSPAGVNFGNQKVGTQSAAAPATLTNVGATAVSITQIAIAGVDAGDFAQTNNCGSSLAGHGSCTINVTFKPTATGSRSAAVNITDNGGASPQSIALAGTGT